MCTKNHILYFLAGATFFHTINHIWLAYSGLLPLTMLGFVVTSQMNTIIIAVSAILTLGLLYAAKSDGGSCHLENRPEMKK